MIQIDWSQLLTTPKPDSKLLNALKPNKYAPQKAWKARNPDKQRQYHRAWRERNKESLNERRREKYKINKQLEKKINL